LSINERRGHRSSGVYERRGHRSSGVYERRGHRSSGVYERRGHRSSGVYERRGHRFAKFTRWFHLFTLIVCLILPSRNHFLGNIIRNFFIM